MTARNSDRIPLLGKKSLVSEADASKVSVQIWPSHPEPVSSVNQSTDVAEERHVAMLRFIRTCRNTKKTPVGGAEQTGGLAEFLAGSMQAWRILALVGQRGPRLSPLAGL